MRTMRHRHARGPRSGFLALGLALVVSSCSSSAVRPSPPSAEKATKGGTLVLGASQEPSCADWYAPCGNSSWGSDMMRNQTLPRVFDLIGDQYKPSVLLTGEPTVDAGPPQRVTYRINPAAVWSDGQPITSLDFAYTGVVAKASGTSTASSAIGTVDTSDPRTAVVTFTAATPAWRETFLRGLLPAHLLEGKDRTAEMRNGYSWSGGPWLIDHWTKGQEIRLVPNPNYWGHKPNLDAVVFKVIPDAAAYQNAYKTGQIDMAFIQGAQPEVTELQSLPDTHFEVSVGFTIEFLAFNTLKPPLDSRAVRQALAYATDRDAIVTQLSGPIMPGIKPLQAFTSPANQLWYSEPFKKYGRDLAMVARLMSGDGWARGPDGVWAKGGARATVELNTQAGNRRRELTEQILQSQWKEAGFEATVNNTTAATITGEWLPKGIFQVALFGQTLNPDPNQCSNFCSMNIPSEANGFVGMNVSRISSPAIDDDWQAVATELDEAKRVDMVRNGQQAIADEVPVLPVSPVLDIVVFNSAKVGGLVKVNPLWAFYNLDAWFCRTSSCQQ
jgi:peptide/nickel transport system substrate-binding protein